MCLLWLSSLGSCRFNPTYNALPGAYLPVVCAPRSTSPASRTVKKGRTAKGTQAKGDSENGRGIDFKEERPCLEGGWDTAQEMKGGGGGWGLRVVHVMKWGLVPSFAPKSDRPDHFKMVRQRVFPPSFELVRRGSMAMPRASVCQQKESSLPTAPGLS